MKISLLMIFLQSLCFCAFANGVVTLKQLGEGTITPGAPITLEVSENSQLVEKEASAISMQYILPYIFIDNIELNGEKVILNGFVTNAIESFQPIKINEKNILFNVTNEQIEKEPIKLEEGFFLFSEKFIESVRKIYQVLIVVFIMISFFLIHKFLYPKIKERKRWGREQAILDLKIRNLKSIDDIERFYAERKKIYQYFNYDEKELSYLLKIIEEEQYKKNWDTSKVEEVLTLAKKLKFEKRKYGRA